MTVTVHITCRACEDTVAIECYYEPADPSTGLRGGPTVPEDAEWPVCPECRLLLDRADVEDAVMEWQEPERWEYYPDREDA